MYIYIRIKFTILYHGIILWNINKLFSLPHQHACENSYLILCPLPRVRNIAENKVPFMVWFSEAEIQLPNVPDTKSRRLF